MKTSLVIASVLLAGVTLQVSSLRIVNNNEQRGNDKEWESFQQSSESSDRSYGREPRNFDQNSDDFQNYGYESHQVNRHNMQTSDDSDLFDSSRQTYDSDFTFASDDDTSRMNYAIIDQSAMLTKKMVQKIAALQKIATENDIVDTEQLVAALNVNKHIIKLSAQNFVTFYNTTMKNLNAGKLSYLYVNPDKDAVLVQYKFPEIEASGLFKSNVQGANSGYYTIVLNNMYSNVSTGFNIRYSAVRPANFQYADANVKTNDGVETREFDAAIERKYLMDLGQVVSSQVLKSTTGVNSVISQMKNEARQPMELYGAQKNGKLFDMRWKEDNVAMDMSNVGFRNAEQAIRNLKFDSVTMQRKSHNVYKMFYNFVIKDLEWNSALTVESSGKRMTARPIDFAIEKAYVQVIVTKSLGAQQQQQQQQQSCGSMNAQVSIRGLRYNFNEDTPLEFRTIVDKKLQQYIEQSLALTVQEYLKQEICYNNKY